MKRAYLVSGQGEVVGFNRNEDAERAELIVATLRPGTITVELRDGAATVNGIPSVSSGSVQIAVAGLPGGPIESIEFVEPETLLYEGSPQNVRLRANTFAPTALPIVWRFTGGLDAAQFDELPDTWPLGNSRLDVSIGLIDDSVSELPATGSIVVTVGGVATSRLVMTRDNDAAEDVPLQAELPLHEDEEPTTTVGGWCRW